MMNYKNGSTEVTRMQVVVRADSVMLSSHEVQPDLLSLIILIF